MNVKIINGGLMTTVQDMGRTGYQASGMQVSGDMDRYSASIANALVGNDMDAALLECTYLGPELEAQEDVLVAVTGGEPNVLASRCQIVRPPASRVLTMASSGTERLTAPDRSASTLN